LLRQLGCHRIYPITQGFGRATEHPSSRLAGPRKPERREGKIRQLPHVQHKCPRLTKIRSFLAIKREDARR